MSKQKKEKVDHEKSKFDYPFRTRLNPYGFLFFRKGLLEDLGWCGSMWITIEKNPDGSITVRKAEGDA